MSLRSSSTILSSQSLFNFSPALSNSWTIKPFPFPLLKFIFKSDSSSKVLKKKTWKFSQSIASYEGFGGGGGIQGNKKQRIIFK